MGAVVTLPTIQRNAEHVAQGLELLIYDVRKPKLSALAASYLGQVQELEDALWFLYLHTMIRDAFGQALDRLGALVTQPRENRTDDVYRTWILARALVLRSSGRIPELLAIARMVLPDTVQVQIVEEYPAGMTITLDGVVDAQLGSAVAALLHKAIARGVRTLVRWQTVATPFRFAAAGVPEMDSANGYGAGGYASQL
jgi:hypothetical protein